MQQYAVRFILLQNHSTSFGRLPRPSSGALKTVTAASGTATSVQRGQVPAWSRWKEVAVPEAAVTVFSAPDDGRGRHPKLVEWFCSKINRTAYCCI